MSDHRDYWEPWQPQVGDWVRFRDSGECRCPTCGKNRHPGVAPDEIDCEVQDVGSDAPITTTCASCGVDLTDTGHRILLKCGRAWGMAAVIELELVERAET